MRRHSARVFGKPKTHDYKMRITNKDLYRIRMNNNNNNNLTNLNLDAVNITNLNYTWSDVDENINFLRRKYRIREPKYEVSPEEYLKETEQFLRNPGARSATLTQEQKIDLEDSIQRQLYQMHYVSDISNPQIMNRLLQFLDYFKQTAELFYKNEIIERKGISRYENATMHKIPIEEVLLEDPRIVEQYQDEHLKLMEHLASIVDRLPNLRLELNDGRDLYLNDPKLYTNPWMLDLLINQVKDDVMLFNSLIKFSRKQYSNFMGEINQRLFEKALERGKRKRNEKNNISNNPKKRFTMKLPNSVPQEGGKQRKKKHAIRRRKTAKRS